MIQSNELYRELEPYLRPEEEVLWVGKPCTTRNLPTTPILMLFPLFFLGFALFWTVMATAMGGAFGLFGLPFVAVGIWMLYYFAVGNKRQLARTVYCVTDYRAVILTHRRHGTDCTEYVFSMLSSVNLESVQGNTGTIRFAPVERYYEEYGYGRHRRGYAYDTARQFTTAFLMIDDVHTVYRLISEQIER